MSGGARQRFRLLSLVEQDNKIGVILNKNKYFFTAKQKVAQLKLKLE